MVDDVVRAQLAHPGLGLGTRGGGDDREAGQPARDLDRHRADAAGAADDEQRALVGALAALDADAVEQELPGGDGRQRQGRGLGEAQPGRLAADDALVDQVVLGVGAGPDHRAGVEHCFAAP